MRQENIILALIITATLLLAGCGSEKAPVREDIDASEAAELGAIISPMRISHNTYSIVMPKAWTEVAQEKNIIVYLPPESKADNPFSEKFGIMVAFMPENVTASLRELTENDIEESIKANPDIAFLGEYEDARLGSIDGLKVEFTMKVDNKEIELTQIRAVQGRVFYAFSQQCVKGKCQHTDVFEDMAKSFAWKQQKP